MRRAESSQGSQQLTQGDKEDLEVVHMFVTETSELVGKSVKELADAMPADSLLVSINKDGQTIIPHGETIIASGDYVSIILREECVEEVNKLFHNTE